MSATAEVRSYALAKRESAGLPAREVKLLSEPHVQILAEKLNFF